MIILFLVVYITSVILIYKKSKIAIISDLFWIFLSWVFSFGLYAFGGIFYRYPLQIDTFIYIIGFWLIYIMGRQLGLAKLSKSLQTKWPLQKNDTVIFVEPHFKTQALSLIAFVSGILYALYMRSNNSIVFGVTRDLKSDMVSSVFLFFSDMGLVVWLYTLIYSLKNGTKIQKTAFLALAAFLIQSALNSGRDAIMVFLLSTFIAFMYCRKSYKKNSKINRNIKQNFKIIGLLAILGALIIFAYFNFLSNARYGNDMIGLFEWTAGAKFSYSLLDVANLFGGFANAFLNLIFYYSAQFSKLNIVYHDYAGPYLYGLFDLNFISRRLPLEWNLNYQVVNAQVQAIMIRRGVSGFYVAWDTIIGTFIYDFGRIGSIVVIGFLGFLIGRFRKYNFSTTYTNDSMRIVMQVFICTAAFNSVQYSPIFDSSWFYPFVWILFFLYIKRKKATVVNAGLKSSETPKKMRA